MKNLLPNAPQQGNLPLPPGFKRPIPPPRPPPGPPPRPMGGLSGAGGFSGVPFNHRHHGPGTPVNHGSFAGTGSQIIPGLGHGGQPLLGILDGNSPAFPQGMANFRGNQPADLRGNQPADFPNRQASVGCSLGCSCMTRYPNVNAAKGNIVTRGVGMQCLFCCLE